MTRTPLRPLARILKARAQGQNPDVIERENISHRHEARRDKLRHRAEGRLLLMGVIVFGAFLAIGGRMAMVAVTDPAEPQTSFAGNDIRAGRADIVDRNGRILATNLDTYSLYAQPPQMIDKAQAVRKLVAIFPELNADSLTKKFTGRRKFVWIRKKLSPEQMQRVHDIGDPGLMFGPREMRLYPNGRLAAHILGGASFGREGVDSAEVIGVAGVEKTFDTELRDPARAGRPLQLSLDLGAQAATRRVLYGGMKLMNARGAAAVLMDVHTGEVLAMVSLPDFDPNNRPRPQVKGDAADSPLFNRAVQGLYELGSVYKIFAVAQALDLGLVTPDTMIDTLGPLRWGKFKIRDFHDYGKQLSVTDVIVKSSNIGAAHIALKIGAERQQVFLKSLGLFDPTGLELVEARGAHPQLPPRWSDLSTMTVAYGHGISDSPLHLAAAYASVLNGGTRVVPTLLRRTAPQQGARVVSRETSAVARAILRQVVVRGTARLGDVPGYDVAGKTGTADKPDPQGGYYKDKVISTFAGIFPANDPKYVLVVSLDEPNENKGAPAGVTPRRTAGWTAVPVAAEIIRRVAPILGLRPRIAPLRPVGVAMTSSSN